MAKENENKLQEPPLTGEELNVVRWWFHAMNSMKPDFLTGVDFKVAKRLHALTGVPMPHDGWGFDEFVNPTQKLRRENFRRLCALHGGPAAVGRHLCRSESYAVRLRDGHWLISDSDARDTELAFCLPAGWLDRNYDGPSEETGTTPTVLYYETEAKAVNRKEIASVIYAQRADGERQEIARHVIDTRNEEIEEALVRQGWTPPGAAQVARPSTLAASNPVHRIPTRVLHLDRAEIGEPVGRPPRRVKAG